jgi:hypothetical protein
MLHVATRLEPLGARRKAPADCRCPKRHFCDKQGTHKDQAETAVLQMLSRAGGKNSKKCRKL